MNTPEAASPGSDVSVPTLHVYTNLEQVPTLVLTPSRERMKPVDASRFRVSLDSGPLFKPTHVREEGNDPISLAILIDTMAPDNSLLPAIEDAIAGLAPDSLRPQDHVSIYAMDCNLIRTTYNLPADAAQLRDGVRRAMESWTHRQLELRSKERKHSQAVCKTSMPLWNSMAYVTQELYRQPGRRVLLAVTDGKDTGSRTTWKQVQELTQRASVAVFGVLTPAMTSVRSREAYSGSLVVTRAFGLASAEDPFDIICELSGGVEVPASRKSLAKTLQRLTGMVRERYILEFPRGNDVQAGLHTIDVTIVKTNAYIRPTGIVLPVADAKVLADPTTLPSDPALAPQLGKRKVLRPSSE